MAGLAGLADRCRLLRQKMSGDLPAALACVLTVALVLGLCPGSVFTQRAHAETYSYTITDEEEPGFTPYVDATLTLGIKLTNSAAAVDGVTGNTTVSSGDTEVTSNMWLGIKITNSAAVVDGVSGNTTVSSGDTEVTSNMWLGIKITNSSPNPDESGSSTVSSSGSEVIAETTLGIKITNNAHATFIDYDLVGDDALLYQSAHNQIIYTKDGSGNTVSWSGKAGGGVQDAVLGDVTTGATVVVPDAPECTGYDFDGWALRINGTLVTEGEGASVAAKLYQPRQTFQVRYADNYQFVAKWSPVEQDYEVNVYLQNANDNDYTLDEDMSAALAGRALTDADITVTAPAAPEGFALKSSGNVLSSWMKREGGANDTLCVYYDRLTYSISFVKPTGEGVPEDSAITGWPTDVANVRYGQTYTLPSKPTADNYNFEWVVTEPEGLAITNGAITMPNQNVVISGTWTEILTTKWLLVKYASATPKDHALVVNSTATEVSSFDDATVKVSGGAPFRKTGVDAGIYQWVDLGKKGDYSDAAEPTLPTVDSTYGVDGYVKLTDSWYVPIMVPEAGDTGATSKGWCSWQAGSALSTDSLKDLANKATAGENYDTITLYARWNLIVNVDIPVDIKMDLDLATGEVSAKRTSDGTAASDDSPWHFTSQTVEPLEIVSISEAGTAEEINAREAAATELFGETNVGTSISNAKVWLQLSGLGTGGAATYNYFLGERAPVVGTPSNIVVAKAASSTAQAVTQVAFNLGLNGFEADKAKLSQADTYSDIAKLKYTVRYSTETTPGESELWGSPSA
ncbi:InlB B-repeat-containing protein [Adlercreutzia sp. ZJ304]|uniref:InlB B-repeat-containing protein n=1 Tax=Adlercreutzia sp. ZJ304 TaxID=2709791 RepID=UPI0013EA8999|nr:InlB B-repeat-containing protein [Adlercreutzia sp. ZJ304]